MNENIEKLVKRLEQAVNYDEYQMERWGHIVERDAQVVTALSLYKIASYLEQLVQLEAMK